MINDVKDYPERGLLRARLQRQTVEIIVVLMVLSAALGELAAYWLGV